MQSREFYIDDMTSALVPLAELFNHDTVKTRYEFYDSENMVFKNTVDLCGNTNDDIQPTMSPIWPKRDISYDPYKEIHLKINAIAAVANIAYPAFLTSTLDNIYVPNIRVTIMNNVIPIPIPASLPF